MNREWTKHAACAGLPPDYFHPSKGHPGGPNMQSQRAKAVCATCNYGYECLEIWLGSTNQADHGVYFGTTPKDRRGLKEILRPALGIVPYSPWIEDIVTLDDSPARVKQREASKLRKRKSRARLRQAKEAA